MRLWRMVATGVVAACLSVVGMAMPAHAAAAPSCVSLSQWDSGGSSYARATNWCGRAVRLRMIWAWAGDGNCTYLPNGYYLQEGRGGTYPYVTELRVC